MRTITYKHIKKQPSETIYLTTEKINSIAKNLYENCFGETFYGNVVWSSKMKKIAGNCRSDGRIALNKNYYINYGKIEILKILKHELAHLYCFQQIGKHTHSDTLFVESLAKLGGAKKGKPLLPVLYIYECPNCKKKWFFSEKQKDEMCCKKCSKGTYDSKFLIQYVGKRVN